MAMIYGVLELSKNGAGIGRFRWVGWSDEDDNVLQEMCTCADGHNTKAEAEKCPKANERLHAIFGTDAAIKFDPDNPTQAQIDAVAGALNKAADDPIAAQSGIILTKMVMRALAEASAEPNPSPPREGWRAESNTAGGSVSAPEKPAAFQKLRVQCCRCGRLMSARRGLTCGNC